MSPALSLAVFSSNYGRTAFKESCLESAFVVSSSWELRSLNVGDKFPIKMTKHLVRGIILLDYAVSWLQMVDNTGVVSVARQFRDF